MLGAEVKPPSPVYVKSSAGPRTTPGITKPVKVLFPSMGNASEGISEGGHGPEYSDGGQGWSEK